MKNLLGKLLICCAFVSFSLHAMAETPDELVRDTSRQVLDVLKRDNGKNTKNIRAEVEALVLPKFDFTRMTALAEAVAGAMPRQTSKTADRPVPHAAGAHLFVHHDPLQERPDHRAGQRPGR